MPKDISYKASVERVEEALRSAGEAAESLGAEVARIVKSPVFRGAEAPSSSPLAATTGWTRRR